MGYTHFTKPVGKDGLWVGTVGSETQVADASGLKVSSGTATSMTITTAVITTGTVTNLTATGATVTTATVTNLTGSTAISSPSIKASTSAFINLANVTTGNIAGITTSNITIDGVTHTSFGGVVNMTPATNVTAATASIDGKRVVVVTPMNANFTVRATGGFDGQVVTYILSCNTSASTITFGDAASGVTFQSIGTMGCTASSNHTVTFVKKGLILYEIGRATVLA